MNFTRRFLSVLLAVVMVFSMLPPTHVHGVEAPRQSASTLEKMNGEKQSLVLPKPEAPAQQGEEMSIPLRVNPLYKDVLRLEDATLRHDRPAPQADYSTQAVMSNAEAAQVIRDGMNRRESDIPVTFVSDTSDYEQAYNEMFELAIAHTGKPKEGDTLKWQWSYTYAYNISRQRNSNGTYTYGMTFYFEYYTTAAQEAELDAAVNKLLKDLNLNGKSDYDKIYAVYEYITSHVTYDYDTLYDDEYTLKYTAYAALMHKTAVCQGYALLFYRLMLELGIDARLIAGLGGGPHGWNIVELDGLYYNVDSTWDAGYPPYYWDYFLNSFWDFLDHERYMEYESLAFHNEYPMAAESYQKGVEAYMDPYIYAAYANEEGTIIWYLGRNGVIYFDGEGELPDFYYDETNSKKNVEPLYSYWIDEIIGAELSEGITRLGDYAFYYFRDLEYVDLPSTMKEIGDYAFYYGWALKEIDLPEGLHTLENAVFLGCESLEEMVLPGSVKNCGLNIFRDCFNMKTLTLSEGITEVPAQFVNSCSNLTTVNLPTTIRTIGDSAFASAWNLRKITIPANVESLGRWVFDYSAVEEITFLGDAPQFQQNSFGEITATAYYPRNNATWTEAVRQNYGGHITWVAGEAEGCTDHDYDAVVTDPTCTEQGYTTYTCSNCGHKYEDNYVPALGHDMGEWIVLNEPDCWNHGQMQRNCSRCDYFEVAMSEPQHTFETFTYEPTCTEDGVITRTCTRCGYSEIVETTPALGHDWHEQYDENGELITVCANCGYVVSVNYSTYFSDFEWEVLLLTNRERMAEGLAPLTGFGQLQQAADIRGMEIHEVFDHLRPDGTIFATVLDELGIVRSGAGENIARGFTGPAHAVQGWMDSDGHRENILRPSMTHMGAGYYQDSTTNWVQIFIYRNGEQYTAMTLYFPNGTSFEVGTEVDDMGIYAVLDNTVYGNCFLPIMEEFITGYDPDAPVDQEVTINALGFTQTFTITRPGCSHTYEPRVTKPTCEEQGYTTYICAFCGDSYVSDYVPALGHNYEDGECTRCGEADPNRQYCGENAWWTFENGTLTISGEGEMYSYYYSPAPWADFRDEITDLVVENGITLIGEAAFSSLRYLKNVSIADSVIYIDHFAFMFCERLETIDLPDQLEAIGQQAFWCCGLKSVVIPASVNFLDVGAFEECKVLTDVLFLSDPNLPGFAMANSLFRNCDALEEIRVEEGHVALRAIDGALYFDTGSGSLSLNDYPIGKKDTTFRVADNTTYISQMAFWNASYLEEITVPAGVTEMGNYVFSGCYALKVIHFEGDMPTVPSSLFLDLNLTITYPCNEPGWSNRAAWETTTMLGHNGSITWQAEHNYVTDTVHPTCFEDGYTTYTCVDCGESYVADVIPATGHVMSGWYTSVQPTCEEEGQEQRGCVFCIYIETRPLDPLGHDFSQWYTAVEATCTEDGQEWRDCKNCEHYETRVIAATGHNYTSKVTAPTCTEQGYTTYTCSNCGHSYVTDVVPSEGHVMGQWELVNAPTCELSGEEQRHCANCEYFESRILEPLTHQYDAVVTEPTCTEQGYTTYTCINCGHSYVDDYVAALDHDFSQWYTAVEPTCTEDGQERRDCIRCEHYETNVIEAKGHEYVDGECVRCHEPEYFVDFVSTSVSLGGNIAMHFYAVLSENLLQDESAYVQFTYGNNIRTVPLSEGQISVKDGVTRYMYSCPITSKNMTDTITAQIYTANGPVGESQSDDVRAYSSWLAENIQDEELEELLHAMLNYGAAAQIQFNYKTDDLANSLLDEEDKILKYADLSEFKMNRSRKDDGIKNTAATMLLDSETVIRIYYVLTGDKTIEDYTFRIDGVEVEPQYQESRDRYYVELPNIGAHKLDEMHVFTVGDEIFYYGPMSYVYDVLTYDPEGSSIYNMALALYNYSAAAEAYIK